MQNINITRPMLPYGFTAFTGKVWPDCHVDSYNGVQDTINSFITAGLPVPEYLLNGSHNLFISYSNNL